MVAVVRAATTDAQVASLLLEQTVKGEGGLERLAAARDEPDEKIAGRGIGFRSSRRRSVLGSRLSARHCAHHERVGGAVFRP